MEERGLRDCGLHVGACGFGLWLTVVDLVLTMDHSVRFAEKQGTYDVHFVCGGLVCYRHMVIQVACYLMAFHNSC